MLENKKEVAQGVGLRGGDLEAGSEGVESHPG